MNARGDAVAAWSGGGAKGVWIANRPAGALFGSPRQVSDGSGPHVAINDAGLAAVAWSAGANGVRAAVGSATEDVSGSDHPASTGWAPLDVAVNRRGDVLVAWFQPDGQLVAAWRPAGGAFGDPQVLGTYGPATVIVTLDDAGRGVVAWASYDPPWRPAPDTPPTRVWVAQGEVGGAFGPPTALSGSGPSDNVDGGFHAAGNARGDVVVTWAVRPTGSSSGPGYGIYAASRSAGGPFEPARRVVAGESSPFPPLAYPVAAVDPRGDAAVTAISPCHAAAVERPAAGNWGALHELFRDCSKRPGDPAAAFDSAGRAVVTTGGARGDGGPAPLLATRLSGGHVETAITVSRPRSHNFTPVLGLDGIGNGLLVWEGDDGENPDKHGLGLNRPIQFSIYDGRPPAISDFGLAPAEPAFKFRVSEPARVTVSVARLKKGREHHVGTTHARALRGRHLLQWREDLRRALRKPGRYRATITARDSANKQARPRQLTFGPAG